MFQKYDKTTMFRHMQLLAAMLHEFQQDGSILVIVIAPIFTSAFAFVTFIRSSNTDIMFLATLVLSISDWLLAIIFTLGQMEMFYYKSKSIIKFMTWEQDSQTPKYLRILEHKFDKSCLTLKILMGSLNFIESLTPLHFLEHPINLSVNICCLVEEVQCR